MGGSITDIQRGLCTAPTGLDSSESRRILTQRMERIVNIDSADALDLVRWDIAEGRRLNSSYSIEIPKNRQWPNEEARLLYLRYFVQLKQGGEYFNYGQPMVVNGPKKDVLIAAMVDYEIKRMKEQTEEQLPIPEPAMEIPSALTSGLNTRGTADEWNIANAQAERDEYELFLLEISLIKEINEAPVQRTTVYSGAATVNVYEQYIGGPFASTVSHAKESVPVIISLMLDFTPIIGQIKGIAEAITGQDIITGRQLADWERGLNVLLAIVPSAKGIFKTGRTGMRLLARVAVDGQLSAKETYRIMKGASKLTEAEVIGAKQIVNGKAANPSQFDKVAGTLDDMVGAPKKGSRAKSYRVASGVIEDGRGVSKNVSGSPINTKAKPLGKPVVPTKTNQAIAARLTNSGISSEAITALEKTGVEITEGLAKMMANSTVKKFVNNFHQCIGFELVVKDLVKQSSTKKGALLVMEFVTDASNKIDPILVKFELPAGITKTAKKDYVGRATDIVITESGRVLNYEFKAYNKSALALFAQKRDKILQLVKDVAMLGRKNIRWVFDSREISRSYVYKKLKEVIKSDPYLTKEFGEGAALEKALDDLILMYPPVPKLAPIPMQGAVKPFTNDE